MLPKLNEQVQKDIRLIMVIVNIFASLAVGANNTAQFYQRIQFPATCISDRPHRLCPINEMELHCIGTKPRKQ